MASQPNYDEYSDVVLYDVFHEAGNVLVGRLVALERQDREQRPEQADAWAEERGQVWGDRHDVDVDDRAAQIDAIARWHARAAELAQLVHSRRTPLGA